jgi:hypothetical protein
MRGVFLSRQVQACNHVKLDIQECQSSQFLMASVNIYLLLAGSLASLCVSAFWGFCCDRASVASPSGSDVQCAARVVADFRFFWSSLSKLVV